MKQYTALFLCTCAGILFAQETLPPPVDAQGDFPIIIEDVPEEDTTAEANVAEVAAVAVINDNTLQLSDSATQAIVATNALTAISEAVIEPQDGESEQQSITPVEEGVEEPERMPNCGHALVPPKGFSTEVLMLQIFLDRHNFSSGVIDGVWGAGSLEAMRAWQLSQNARPSSWIDLSMYQLIAEMVEPLIRVEITTNDLALVTGPLPATWAERARLQILGYETMGTCLAERYHTSERTLKYLNPSIINWPEDLVPGLKLTVPNVCSAALEKPVALKISLTDCLIVGYDAKGIPCLRFPCSIAKNKAHLPKVEQVTIKTMAPAPNYTYDPANYGQDPSIGKIVVPAGPRNPVGTRWIGLSLPGYGIHGTPRPNTVGRPESRGCFRLTNWNIEKLFELVAVGMPIEILPGKLPSMNHE